MCVFLCEGRLVHEVSYPLITLSFVGLNSLSHIELVFVSQSQRMVGKQRVTSLSVLAISATMNNNIINNTTQ